MRRLMIKRGSWYEYRAHPWVRWAINLGAILLLAWLAAS